MEHLKVLKTLVDKQTTNAEHLESGLPTYT